MIHEDTGNRKEEEPPTSVSPDNTCRLPEIRERGLKADNGGLSESHRVESLGGGRFSSHGHVPRRI